ncbi:hypothetical protein SAMN05443668_105377 [Cryptosporangium aurantiacum]|uniref:Uncharacterized protein n=1 Tax=Cryptosporangium aurantiacum TaxID=134849 RepID=A0A1M7QU37_9ACTN|nr:XRE family transcriptional regulator [Cryptosporangium aurantiacum]SHN35288.1 hypothetical protein SAMN05443668_105377 [Cryptosporangium aurantiacum]
MKPDDLHMKLIAKSFGTVTAALFPTENRRQTEESVIAVTGMDTVEILARIRASDVSPATLDALRITADRLCCEYPHAASPQLQVEGRSWLSRITRLLDGRLTLAQHQEVLSLAGQVALLLGCVEYDMGKRGQAEVTRKAALSLGEEADNSEVIGWAQEMRAWYALTQGNYEGAVAAAQAGRAVAEHSGVTVQLAAQQAKAWARMGDRRQMELALDRGRSLLEVMPEPEDTDHHFVVDPSKFDFYAMDCYRIVGEDRLATMYADEVIRNSTNVDGTHRKPMRVAEAEITLGVAAARDGDVESAVNYGRRALRGERKSLPSLVMCSRELATLMRTRYQGTQAAADYLEELRAVSVA